MERLKELITQLKEQFDRKAEPSQMLETAKLLQAELQLLASQPAPAKVMPTKITVMMPSASKIYAGQQPAQPSPSPEPRHEPAPEPRREPAPEPRREPAPVRDVAAQRNGIPNVPAASSVPNIPSVSNVPAVASVSPALNGAASLNGTGVAIPGAANIPTPTAAEPEIPVEIITIEKAPERGQWPFDPLAEKPTDRFTLSQRAREVNDVIGSTTTSLNDKLKSE
ncbi:MAG TPA: hypothetical protein VHW43_00140, partial [Puia sp.]|nr:hypothetical protein [Puia sp.]